MVHSSTLTGVNILFKMENKQEILSFLPYKPPFLFVDDLLSISDDRCEGVYQIKEDEYFFKGHFPGTPIVPGVIVTEIMAQIGLVCLGIHLSADQVNNEEIIPVFSSSEIQFLSKVGPGDLLKVKSKKVYFRLNKLKCAITCLKGDTIVAKGTFSGMIINKSSIE